MRTILGLTLGLTVLLLQTSILALAQDRQSAQGHWEGIITLADRELAITFDIDRDDSGAWSATIDVPSQGFRFYPLSQVAVDGSTLSFAVPVLPGDPVFKATLSEDGQILAGTLSRGGKTFPFKLVRKAVDQTGVSAKKDIAQAAEPPSSGFRAAFLSEFDESGKKLVDLAEAIPAEKYSWRPGDGVRSLSEVLMHVAGGNFVLPTFMGIKAPRGTHLGLEKTVTQKAKVVELVKQSFAHVRRIVLDTPEANLNDPVKFWGHPDSVVGVFLRLSSHANEHLGQLIAYARFNKITPPWSEAAAGP